MALTLHGGTADFSIRLNWRPQALWPQEMCDGLAGGALLCSPDVEQLPGGHERNGVALRFMMLMMKKRMKCDVDVDCYY